MFGSLHRPSRSEPHPHPDDWEGTPAEDYEGRIPVSSSRSREPPDMSEVDLVQEDAEGEQEIRTVATR